MRALERLLERGVQKSKKSYRRQLILAPCVFTVPAPNSFSSLANFLRPEKCTRFCDLKGPTRELSGRRAACHALLNGGDCRTDKMDSRFLPLYSRCGLFPAFLERRLTQFFCLSSVSELREYRSPFHVSWLAFNLGIAFCK